jgi:hypothetical protein
MLLEFDPGAVPEGWVLNRRDDHADLLGFGN